MKGGLFLDIKGLMEWFEAVFHREHCIILSYKSPVPESTPRKAGKQDIRTLHLCASPSFTYLVTKLILWPLISFTHTFLHFFSPVLLFTRTLCYFDSIR